MVDDAAVTARAVADAGLTVSSLCRGGVIPLGPLLSEIHTRTGFDGPLEVEVLNRDVWARPADEVVIDIRRRMTGILASRQDAR